MAFHPAFSSMALFTTPSVYISHPKFNTLSSAFAVIPIDSIAAVAAAIIIASLFLFFIFFLRILIFLLYYYDDIGVFTSLSFHTK